MIATQQIEEQEREQSKKMLVEARQYFRKAIDSEPNRITLLQIDLASTCMILADLSEAEERSSYLSEAKTFFTAVEEVSAGILLLILLKLKGRCAFDLAVLAAMNKDSTSCRDWLYVALSQQKLPPVANLKSNVRLATMHQEKWFQVAIYFSN
jgi:hypothetical protein